MKRVGIGFLVGSALLATSMFAWQTAPAPVAPQPEATANNALVKQYCVGCHSTKLKTAGVALEGLDISKASEEAATWESVLRKVKAGQMPPAGMPHPTPAATTAFTTFLQAALDREALAHPNPGRPTIHRLNRAEYSNAVRDLLALDVKPGATLPADDTGYGFDNIGDVLSLSPVLIERYMSAARMVARLAIGNVNAKPEVSVYAPVREVRAASKGGPRVPRNERVSDDLPFDSAGGLSVQHSFPVDAEYIFKVKMPNGPAPAEGAVPLPKTVELKVPVSAGLHQVGLTFMRSGAVPEIVPALAAPRGGGGGGRGAAGAPPVGYMDLRLDGARLKLFEVQEGQNGPQFTDLSIAGPYDTLGAGNSASRQRIFICKPAAPAQESACAAKILSAIGRRAYRRTFTQADLKPLMSFYLAGRKEGSFDNGIEMALRAMLVSPNFLFRVERDSVAASGSVRQLSDFELASRLSFFLWSTIPDDELLNIAEKGKLKDRAVMRQQVARMLDNPKSKAFVENFAGQWLFLRNLAQVKPDPDEFPAFDNSLRRGFERETQLFFTAIMRENRPLTDLLTANFTFLNQRLAEHYGIPGVYGPQFRRVEISDPNRAGILGQGSLLTVTSYPNRTSVVQRGKWVLENLLGTPPPPPPPNIPSLDAHTKDGAKISMRAALEQHRANPVCASCHSRMDPIGFSLENYDGIGAWRTEDNGAKIDPSGKMPDGKTFSGPEGLRNLLVTQHREEFVSTFTEKLLTYALGRGLESYDRPAMRSIMREAEQQNTTIPAIIDAIVNSPQFQMRRTRES